MYYMLLQVYIKFKCYVCIAFIIPTEKVKKKFHLAIRNK